ncbi:hypothetical protein BDV93DRAFT_555181 [Ceratobasidium sp. AG-I]|nr:hypothetical protein BDV93DRAFT_555181 [Ceratobasidium sp. AG-I]
MMRDIAMMELHGPAHRMVISTSMDKMAQNPHLMAAAFVKDWATQEYNHWLPLEFFDQSHPNHYDWSLLSLLYCVRNIRPHIHPETQTVLGGLYGVRVLGYCIRRVALNLHSIIMRESIPDPISAAMRRSSSLWNTLTASELLGQSVTAIRQDIERSNVLLMESFPQRSRSWVEELNKLNEDIVTCGLPSSLPEAHAMWVMLPRPVQPTEGGAVSVGQGSQSALKQRDMRYRSNRRAESIISKSPEEIDLPKDDELSSTSNSLSASPSPAPSADSLPEPDTAFRNIEVPSIHVDRSRPTDLGVAVTEGLFNRMYPNPALTSYGIELADTALAVLSTFGHVDQSERVNLAETNRSDIPDSEAGPAPRTLQENNAAPSRQKGVKRKNTKKPSEAAVPEGQGTSGRPVRVRKRLPQAQATIDAAAKGSYKR